MIGPGYVKPNVNSYRETPRKSPESSDIEEKEKSDSVNFNYITFSIKKKALLTVSLLDLL